MLLDIWDLTRFNCEDSERHMDVYFISVIFSACYNELPRVCKEQTEEDKMPYNHLVHLTVIRCSAPFFFRPQLPC